MASPDGLWQARNEVLAGKPEGELWIRPARFSLFTLNTSRLHKELTRAPLESLSKAQTDRLALYLPTPEGTFASFEVVESPVMAPKLAAKFPEIRTYCGEGIDDPGATLRMDWTPSGFHAQVLSPKG